MAINNIINDQWQGHSHGEVEDALKALLAQMLQDIEAAGIPAGGVTADMLAQSLQTLINGKYSKPGIGIPASDLAQAVQTSLGKANSALQGVKDSSGNLLPVDTDGVVTLPESEGGGSDVTVDEAMSSTSDNPVQNKVIKAYVDSLINGLINGAPAALDTLKELADALGDNEDAVTALVTALAGKQDAIPDLSTIRTGAGKGATALQPADVRVEAPATPDGTFTLNAGNNEFNVNLNHTHDDMVKLVVEAGEDLPDPEDMSEDTIYGAVEDGEITVIYLGGYPFYGGGGGSSTPRLISPANGSTIDCGTNQGSGVEKTITVKGVNLTAALTVAVTGTGFSIKNGTSSISATDANAGTTLTIVYSGTSANATGTLSFTSSTDGINSSIALEADYEDPYAGIEYDKACRYRSSSTDIATVAGYCMTPKYVFPVGHQLRIHFGFKDASNANPKYGAAGWKTEDGSGLPAACFTSDAGDANTERNIPTSGVNNGNPPYTFIAATFKTSELDDCFLYDLTSQEWLFAGVNVDKSNPPTNS